jgi:hypothetical protein
MRLVVSLPIVSCNAGAEGEPIRPSRTHSSIHSSFRGDMRSGGFSIDIRFRPHLMRIHAAGAAAAARGDNIHALIRNHGDLRGAEVEVLLGHLHG